MRYQISLLMLETELELSVTPLPEGSLPSAPRSGHVVSLQAVEDWLPMDFFFSSVASNVPAGSVEWGERSLRIVWQTKKASIPEITSALNEIAAPGRFGRCGGSYADVIGRTPLVHLSRIAKECQARIFLKLESMEPGSVKDRAVLRMVSEAIRRGDVKPQTEVVEASSGNLAFALSAILGVMCGKKPTIFMSKMHGVQKRRAVRLSGSRVVLTTEREGTLSAKRAATRYAATRDEVFETNQHGNPDNPGAHELTTGPEIYHQTHLMAGRAPDEIVCSLGSGGTAVGLAMFRDDIRGSFRVIGVEPEGASLLTGGTFAPHRFSGMAPGWITDILKEHAGKLDEIVAVREEEAFHVCQRMLVEEGFLVGPSSGAAIAVALKRGMLPEYEGKVIVAFAHDRGDRYLDIPDLFMPPEGATEEEMEDLE